MMLNTVGHRETERGLMLGHLYGTEEALKVGLIDQIVPLDQIQTAAQQEMAKWLKIPGMFSVFCLHVADLDHTSIF